ncbi:DNA-binding transcriptional LysR family regulator [Paenibacillus forsythiae]|uniref:DNA-binding transcriptional LysR family regulator n=1 Tax=Paenibacillus forsythiae TaxID=365616 RepID=A0ABU3H432_9BACL|nr:LysR family transcriptional regulator [Paenibacillus forsythiae]MDT3425583.1 DNA-binding transcriptional LysR family regulator [Paenibacillus forsythiae]
MHIQQLIYFMAIKKYQSFSLAADELCLTQSALSKQIKALENELNTLLIDRKTRHISLTAAGSDFAMYAEKLLENYNEMISNMKKHSLLEKGFLSVAAIPVMSQYGITSKIASFCISYPQIRLEITEKENDLILGMLRNSEVDVALIRVNYIPDDLVRMYPLMSDELTLVVPAAHPLAGRSGIELKDAASEKFILLNPASGIYRTCLEECQKARFTPDVLYTNSRIETIIALVAEGLGVSLLMKRVVEYFKPEGVSIVPLNNPAVSTLALAAPKHKELTPAAKAFIDFVRQSV